MKDYIEILSFFGYDVYLAQIYIDTTYHCPEPVIESILTEAGLD